MRYAPAVVVIEDQEEIFHSVASQGMLSSVVELLAEDRFSCDLRDRFGRTPLHWAAEQGHRNVVLALLRAGACIDPRSQRKTTPIMLAASRGHAEVVLVLIHYHAGESDRWPSSYNTSCGIAHWRSTALHCAAAGGHVRVIEALLDAGFNRGQHDGAGLIPAEVSARQSHYTSPAITHLLLPTSDMGGQLVYDYVNMAMQDVAMVSGLAKGGAFLDWQDGTGFTPLHRAAHFHHATISRVLLQADADPNLCDHSGVSPLHVAIFTGCVEIVADLLKAGADMEHRDAIHGQTPLSSACKGCSASIVRALVRAGADVESTCSAGLTPLHWACRFNATESVEALLKAGADPGALDQAAADAVAKSSSSSRSGTIVSRPIAIDVIGLGQPLDRMDDSTTQLSDMLAARRLDLTSVGRIELALRRSQQERSWRRRGWLVILENRQASSEIVRGGGGQWAVDRSDCSPVVPASRQSRRASTDIIDERPPHAHQQEAGPDRCEFTGNSGSSGSSPVQSESSDGKISFSQRSRNVDKGVMTARASPGGPDQTRGDIGAHDCVAAPPPGLVGAVLELAAVEVGVFRRVVVFI